MVLALAVLAFGQSDRGTISGTVLDKSGAVIPGAKVTVTNAATNTSVQLSSNEAGEFTAPSLAAGQYNIRAEKEGFRPAVLNNLTLNAASSAHADMTLEVGSTQTAVEVQASAIQLQTEDAKTSVAVTNKLVDELPLVVGGAIRSPFDLANITPEAKPLGGDNGFVLGGGQAAGYGTNLDGVSANTTRALSQSWVAVNAPSVEAITEFTVDTNGFKAEYGHASGGVMNFVSKSGTNEFHGNAYEFLRNDAFDANNWFNNALNRPKPVYKQHDYGATFGGYAWLPKIYNGKNKTFFFASYEAFRNRAGASSSSATVPTPEMYEGDFSKWVDASGNIIPIYDPTTQTTDAAGNVTRQPFPGNMIPKSKFDPVSVKTLAAYTSSGLLKPNNGAAPGTVGYINNNYFIAAGSEVRPQTKFSIKGDHVLNDKHRLGGYYGYNRSSVVPSPIGPATLPGNYTNYNDTQRNSDVYRMSWDWTLSPTKFNHFYAGANNWRENHDPPQATVKSGIDWKDKVCLGNVPDCGQNLLNLDFNSNGYTSWGGRANNGSENTIFSFNNDFTWIRGKHSFKLGGQHQRSHYNGFGRQCISGCAGFSFIGTGRPGDTNFNTAGGNPFASFLLGWATNGSIDTIRFISQQWPYYAGYFQDDYKVSQKLTLNLGLRWETQLPPVEANDRWSDFSPTRPNPKAGNIPGALIYAGDGAGREGSRTLADSYFNAWGPRFGFAYQANDKMVIRGSYALSYGAITTVTGSTHQRGFTQTYNVSTGNNGISPAFMMSQGFPAYPVPPFIDPSFANKDNIPWWQGREATRPPEMNSFNLSMQRQFKGNTVVELGYNGVMGSHLQSGLLNYDQVDPRYLFTLGPTVLNSRIDSPAGIASGVKIPYANFIADWGSNATVARALRPFPQYNGIDTASGGGDHSGHSTYHALMIRGERRYSAGFTLLASYVFSKLLTDSDGYWVGGAAMDHFNRGLEKSIGQYDVPHNFKFSGIYELPFGKGKAFLTSGLGNAVLGGWRLSGIAIYTSGQPVGLGTTISNPIFAGGNRPTISTYDGWQGATASGSFNPFTDRFFQPASFFGAQPAVGFGNMTRYNPKLRYFNNLNENLSVAKSFHFTERLHLDFRAEAFNVFNRHRFGTGSWTLQDQNFGRLTSSADLLNTPRQMQFGLKLNF